MSVKCQHRDERIRSGAYKGWWKCWLCGRKTSKTVTK